MEKEINNYSHQIADAVSLELIYQIMRRYQAKYDLRIFETHPGGGQYDCLSLYACKDNKREHFFDFNLAAQSLHVWRNEQRRFDVVDDYLQAKDPKIFLDLLCRTAGQDVNIKLPPSTGPVIAYGLMAKIIQSQIFSPDRYKLYMAYWDTSGVVEGGIREELARLFKTAKNLLDMPAELRAKKAYRYFFLKNISTEKVICLFDMKGIIHFPDDTEFDLLKLYDDSSRDIDILFSRISSKLWSN
jgi:hypothetical protein